MEKAAVAFAWSLFDGSSEGIERSNLIGARLAVDRRLEGLSLDFGG